MVNVSDIQTIANKAAGKCSLIFTQRPYGTGVQFEDIRAAEKQFAGHIQDACKDATRDLLAACKGLMRRTEANELVGTGYAPGQAAYDAAGAAIRAAEGE